MPQLDIVTYVGQYIWTLVSLLLLFSLLISGILPRLQQQLGLRTWAEEGLIGNDELNGKESLDLSKGGLIEVFKNLCNQ